MLFPETVNLNSIQDANSFALPSVELEVGMEVEVSTVGETIIKANYHSKVNLPYLYTHTPTH